MGPSEVYILSDADWESGPMGKASAASHETTNEMLLDEATLILGASNQYFRGSQPPLAVDVRRLSESCTSTVLLTGFLPTIHVSSYNFGSSFV